MNDLIKHDRLDELINAAVERELDQHKPPKSPWRYTAWTWRHVKKLFSFESPLIGVDIIGMFVYFGMFIHFLDPLMPKTFLKLSSVTIGVLLLGYGLTKLTCVGSAFIYNLLSYPFRMFGRWRTKKRLDPIKALECLLKSERNRYRKHFIGDGSMLVVRRAQIDSEIQAVNDRLFRVCEQQREFNQSHLQVEERRLRELLARLKEQREQVQTRIWDHESTLRLLAFRHKGIVCMAQTAQESGRFQDLSLNLDDRERELFTALAAHDHVTEEEQRRILGSSEHFLTEATAAASVATHAPTDEEPEWDSVGADVESVTEESHELH